VKTRSRATRTLELRVSASTLLEVVAALVVVAIAIRIAFLLFLVAVLLALVVGGLLQGVLGAVLVLPLVAAHPIIERIRLATYLGSDVVTDHTVLAASVGTVQEHAVEKSVIRGEALAPPPS
jgi:hypothetical protein